MAAAVVATAVAVAVAAAARHLLVERAAVGLDEDGGAVRLAVLVLALVLGARAKVVGADAVLLPLLPRAAVPVAVGVGVDAVVGVRRAVPLAVELLAVRVHENAVARRRARRVRPLEDLAALEVVGALAVVLAARPVADVAVAVGVDVNAVAALLPVLPVPRVLVAAVVVVHAVAVALPGLDVADVLEPGRPIACTQTRRRLVAGLWRGARSRSRRGRARSRAALLGWCAAAAPPRRRRRCRSRRRRSGRCGPSARRTRASR